MAGGKYLSSRFSGKVTDGLTIENGRVDPALDLAGQRLEALCWRTPLAELRLSLDNSNSGATHHE